MPEGSLAANIQTLQQALLAIGDLLGVSPEGGASGSGFAGAAGLASHSPVARVQTFGNELTEQISGLLQFDAASGVTGITSVFETLRGEAQGSPTAALDQFTQRLAQADSALLGDFVERLQQALEAVRSISQSVPENRAGIFSALLDQILGVLGSLEGEEAVTIRSWILSLQAFYDEISPLIRLAETTSDPATLVVQVMRRSVDRLLQLIGFGDVQDVVTFLDAFPGNMLAPSAVDAFAPILETASSGYSQLLAGVDASFPQFRSAVVAVGSTMEDLRRHLRPVLSLIRRIAGLRILQPGVLEDFLREKMEGALAIPVQEVQRIDDPFNALFDRIDEAIQAIDLSVVRTEVLGFFDNLQTTIQQVDIGSLADTLQAQLATVSDAIQGLQQGVTDLLGQIEAFFDSLTERFCDLAGGVGAFQPDGSFRYSVEDQLRQIFTTARQAIGGDPHDPDSPSLAGSLNTFQSTIEQFLSQIGGLLDPLGVSIDTARTTVVEGINTFSGYLEGLNLPDLVEQLRQKVEEIVDALLPIDFNVVVDPVVAEIEESTGKLRDVDADSLNDLLKEALKVALDVVIQIDFTVAISDPLKEQFGAVKAVPQNAIDQLQRRYEQALSVLDSLKPEKLLEALFSAFDIIQEAVGALDVATLLQPLDRLHTEHLQQPLAGLKPSTLLQPVSDAFQDFTSVFNTISGSAILAPLSEQLDALKRKVADLDATAWIDNLISAVATVKADLRDIRPSELLQPVTDELARLEGELDRFRPSVLFQPVLELAGPLLQFLDSVQQETIDALHALFQAPLEVLDRIEPQRLTREIQDGLGSAITLLRSVDLPTRFNQLKAHHFDLLAAVRAGGIEARIELIGLIDPERQLGALVRAYSDMIAILEGIQRNLQLPDLAELYSQLREKLLGFLPPFARELLDPETFKRVMRLADPTRFLQALDERFEAVKARLLPVSPTDVAGELDETYDAVLALVDSLEVEESLSRVKETIDNAKNIVSTIRVDFLAGDIDRAVNDFRALVAGLDPTRIFEELDGLHHEVELVVASTVPSQVLSGLQEPLDQVQAIVTSVDPRVALGPPLNDAWESVQGLLDAIDFTVILSPIVEKLDELEAQFEASLRRTETAFDQMLGAARGALGGGASAGASIGGSV